ELVPVILGTGALEVIQRRLELALIVEDVREVDARFRVIAVELERATQRANRRIIIAEAMLRVADACDGFRGFRRVFHRRLEKLLGGFKEFGFITERTFAEERTADLKHQVDVVRITQLEGPMETALRGFILPKLEERLAKSGEPVFVLRLEHQGLLERAA